MFRILALIGLTALAACASAPAEDCGPAAAQFDAGAAGFARQCASAGAQSVSAPAAGGAEMTATEYCSAENGFAVGARGEAYAGLCSGPQAQAFLARHSEGERLFSLERAVIAASFGASDANKELWRVKRRIMQVETMRISTSTPSAERAEHARELKSLFDEKAERERELDLWQARKDQAEAELEIFRRGLAPYADGAGPTPPTETSFEPP